MAASHRFGQQTASHPPCVRRRDRFREEKPDMCAVSRTGSFHCGSEAIFVTTLAECADVCLSACRVKICHQQICCVILIQAFCFAIDAYINQSSRDIFAETSYLQQWLNDVIYEREQMPKTKMVTFILNNFNHKHRGRRVEAEWERWCPGIYLRD